MITATFKNKETFNTVSDEVWQYDYGQVLQIVGLDLSAAVEIDFATSLKGDAKAVTVVGTTSDGVTQVTIPDEMFNIRKISDYEVYAFIFEIDEDSGETTHQVTIPVRTRPRREEYEGEETDNPFNDVLKEVSKALAEAQEAAEEAAETARLLNSRIEQIDTNTTDIDTLKQRVTVLEEDVTILQTEFDALGLSVDDGEINITYQEV